MLTQYVNPDDMHCHCCLI